MLTTVIRAMQYTMDVAVETKKLKLPDQEAIILFLNFYKLIFLGTKFAEKVLQIKLQPQGDSKGEKKPLVDIDLETEETKDNGEGFIIDTSEISENDQLQPAVNSGSSVLSSNEVQLN